MADTKTSDESAGATPDGSELIRAVQGAGNVKLTANQLLTRADGAAPDDSGTTITMSAGNSNATGAGNGGNVTLTPGDGEDTGLGGAIVLVAANGSGQDVRSDRYVGGAVNLDPGPWNRAVLTTPGAATGSNASTIPLHIATGPADGAGNTGDIFILPGNGNTASDAPGGNIWLTSNDAGGGNHNGGEITLTAGLGAGTGRGGGVYISSERGGTGATGAGGPVGITTGAARSTDDNGGDLTITLGAKAGTGRNGLIIIHTLPTSDPGVSGALWNNAGTLKISP